MTAMLSISHHAVSNSVPHNTGNVLQKLTQHHLYILNLLGSKMTFMLVKSNPFVLDPSLSHSHHVPCSLMGLL